MLSKKIVVREINVARDGTCIVGLDLLLTENGVDVVIQKASESILPGSDLVEALAEISSRNSGAWKATLDDSEFDTLRAIVPVAQNEAVVLAFNAGLNKKLEMA